MILMLVFRRFGTANFLLEAFDLDCRTSTIKVCAGLL